MGSSEPRRNRRSRNSGATVADVARRAGLSPMTVSRVINGSGNVLGETRARVQAAIVELGYVPNAAARSLAGRGPARLVLLHSNPSAAWLSEFLVGSLDGAAAAHAQLIVEHWDGQETPSALAARLVAQRIDGVVLPPPLCDDPSLLAALASAGIGFAQVASGAPITGSVAVSIGDEAAAQAMTRHLIGLGHRRVGFVTGDANQTASGLRRAGYLRALGDAGITEDAALIVAGDFTYRGGLAAATQLLDLAERPTAIFASNDDMAAAAVSVAHRRGIDVPGELSVCGFDDTAIARTIWPELTTIRQPVAEMARRAVAELAAAPSDLLPVTMPFELIARASSGPVPT